MQSADYMFPSATVIAELKVLQTEFAHTKETVGKVDALAERYPGIHPVGPAQPLRRELLSGLKSRFNASSTRPIWQIKEAKAELGLDGWRGVLICMNDNLGRPPPSLVVGLIGRILAGTSCKSITAVIYQTNHYVELVEIQYAHLLWAPMYSEVAGDDLLKFVNDLGRKWRSYAESIEGPYDFSSKSDSIQLAEASVVTGIYRNREYKV